MTHSFVKKSDAGMWVTINMTDRTYFHMLKDPQWLGRQGMAILRETLAKKYPDMTVTWVDPIDFESGRDDQFIVEDGKMYRRSRAPVGATVAQKASSVAVEASSPAQSPISDEGNPECTCDSTTHCPIHEYH
jgi:hypothetical protein